MHMKLLRRGSDVKTLLFSRVRFFNTFFFLSKFSSTGKRKIKVDKIGKAQALVPIDHFLLNIQSTEGRILGMYTFETLLPRTFSAHCHLYWFTLPSLIQDNCIHNNQKYNPPNRIILLSFDLQISCTTHYKIAHLPIFQ